jgi:hypothetical protein
MPEHGARGEPDVARRRVGDHAEPLGLSRQPLRLRQRVELDLQLLETVVERRRLGA